MERGKVKNLKHLGQENVVQSKQRLDVDKDALQVFRVQTLRQSLLVANHDRSQLPHIRLLC